MRASTTRLRKLRRIRFEYRRAGNTELISLHRLIFSQSQHRRLFLRYFPFHVYRNSFEYPKLARFTRRARLRAMYAGNMKKKNTTVRASNIAHYLITRSHTRHGDCSKAQYLKNSILADFFHNLTYIFPLRRRHFVWYENIAKQPVISIAIVYSGRKIPTLNFHIARVCVQFKRTHAYLRIAS